MCVFQPSVLVGDGGKSWYQTQRRNQEPHHPNNRNQDERQPIREQLHQSRSKLSKKQERNRLKRLKKKQRQQQHKNKCNPKSTGTSSTTNTCNEDNRSSFLYGKDQTAHTLDTLPSPPRRRRIDPFTLKRLHSKQHQSSRANHPRPESNRYRHRSNDHHAPRPPGFKTYITSSNQEDLNKISAQILKAKLAGNDTLCIELEKKRDALREQSFDIEHQYVSSVSNDQTQRNDNQSNPRDGNTDNVYGPKSIDNPNGNDTVNAKDTLVSSNSTDAEGLILDGKLAKEWHEMEEMKGIKDSDDIQTMLKKERHSTALDHELSRVGNRKLNAIQSLSHSDDRFDAIDSALISNESDTSNGSKRKRGRNGGDNEERMRMKKRARLISEHRQKSSWLSSCAFCVENEEVHNRDMAHCVVYYGQFVYLAVPKWKGLVPLECIIVPNAHLKSFREGMDHNEQIGASKEEQCAFEQELDSIKKMLCKVFREKFNSGVLFMETVRNLKRNYHSVIHCYPMERELFDLCPIYFEKAILESDVMWSTNKRLVTTTKEKPLRAAIPLFMAYFYVQFGCDEGFVHVIEDETKIKQDFGPQIVAGIVGEVLFKMKRDGYRQQRERADVFKAMFEPYKAKLDKMRITEKEQVETLESGQQAAQE